ncbi:MAG: GntR family transcriptional regulator [Spirochaetaceae bacterium]|nr:GntR family transcriptional regulator [Spirochaetaceae bacterium]
MKPANTEIFDNLKERIINLELKPGDSVVEKDLIREFGVSRTPVREALIKLSQIGLIETRPQVGTFVTPIDLKSVKDAFEVKKNLESLAAELAARRADDEQIKELFEIIGRFSRYDSVRDYKLCINDDQRFHQIIGQASNNKLLIEMLDQLNTKTARFFLSIEYIIDDYDWFYGTLKDMAHAIKERDPEKARSIMERHTLKFVDQMSRRFFMGAG